MARRFDDLQNVGAGTTPVWTKDTSNAPGLCEPISGDPWIAVPVTPTTIATTTTGVDASVDLVWGVRSASNQPPGSYAATISFETIAPAA